MSSSRSRAPEDRCAVDSRSQAAYWRIEERTAGFGGEEYFRRLVLALNEAFQARFALAARLIPNTPWAEVTAAADRGRTMHPFCYALPGTPCEGVAGGSLCFHPDDVLASFPRDEFLRAVGARAYLGAPLFDRGGQPLGLIVVVDERPMHDRTYAVDVMRLLAARCGLELERTRDEQRLNESERRFRLLAENVPGVIFRAVHDERFTILYTNDRIEELTGYEKEAFLEGRVAPGDLFHPEDARWIPAAIDSALERRRPFHIVHRMRRRDGSVCWVELHGVGVFAEDDETLSFLQGFVLDVSDRKKAESEIRESYMRYRSMFEDNWASKLILEPHSGRIVDLNDSAAALFALDRSELVGKSVLDYLNEDADRFQRLLARSESSGSPRGEFLLRDAQGEEHTIEIFAGPMRLAGRDVVFAILHDVTDLKRTERERRRLEERVRRSQRLESLGVLAGGIAHDFNNLLVGILANADLARQRTSDRPDVTAALLDVERAARRASELARQMLVYSGRGRARRERVRLAPLVRETLDLLKTHFAGRRIRVDLSPTTGDVEGDATQIRQIVMNLLTNAVEALPPERGTVSVRLADEEVMSPLALEAGGDLPPGRYALLEVCDDGMGIPVHVREKIFDPFFSTKFAGRGLGLAAVLGIASSHGGGLVVESSPGQGTRFRVYLPTIRDAASRPSAGREPRRGSLRPAMAAAAARAGKVLVVDDELIVRRAARACLEQAGFEVVEAERGDEAIERLGTDEGIACVLLDLTMPGGDGREVLQRVRRGGSLVPIVLTSGYAAREALAGLRGDPLTTYLEKPFRGRELVERVARAILASETGNAEKGDAAP